MPKTDHDTTAKPSYLGLVVRLAGTMAILIGIVVFTIRGERPRPAAPILAEAPGPAIVIEVPHATPLKSIEPDKAAIARAEAAVDAAARDRGHAEVRLADAAIALRKAGLAATGDSAVARSLGARVKDPTARIERATNRIAIARWEVKKLSAEVDALAKTPRTKARPLIDQAAVAKPVDGKEFHFEIRRDRVAYIDLEKLSELVKADVRLRLKFAASGQAIAGTVGPIGDFSMRYEMGSSISGPIADMLDVRHVSYQLQGWEIVPDHESRGLTYQEAWGPGAEFARVIGRLNPSSATITLWIYPDGFPLYRRLRDDLHVRGFLVAARPLPDGMAIRGSPVGSLSAGQ